MINTVYVTLRKPIDQANETDRYFINYIELVSADSKFHYTSKKTEYSGSVCGLHRYFVLDSSENLQTVVNSIRKWGKVSDISVTSPVSDSIGITGNPVSFKCMHTANIVASRYNCVTGIWPRQYAQGLWDSSALVCFKYVIASTGTSSTNCVHSLVDSTVTLNVAYYVSPDIPNLLDPECYMDKPVLFPTRSVSPYHSLQKYRVAGAEAQYTGGYLRVALELCGNDVDRTPMTSSNSLYNEGIRSGYGDSTTQTSAVVLGLCPQLHFSADSSDALCMEADYESGESYLPAAPQRSDSHGWNTDGLQAKDATTNTGFNFDGLVLSPVIRDRMTFGSSEGSSVALWHHDFGGNGDRDAALTLYNSSNHPVFVNNMRKVLEEDDMLSSHALAADVEEDWSLSINDHFAGVAGVVGARWNETGTVGVAPGCKIDPEVGLDDILLAADYGVADVISHSLGTSYSNFFGLQGFYDVIGDRGDIPVGSIANSEWFDYLNNSNVWLVIPPHGNNSDEYYYFPTEIVTIGAFSAWDATTPYYAHGEAVDFVSPIPVMAPKSYYSPSGDENNRSTCQEFGGQSCTTPCGAAHFLLLKEARPELDFMEAKQIMANSCRKFPDMQGSQSNWHYKYGFGRPDINLAVSTDLTSAGCPSPKGLIVDGAGTPYAKLRWTNPHYRNFYQTKIVRKEEGSGSSYGTFINVHSTTIDEYPVGVEQGEKLEWIDLITTSPNGLSVTDSTYYSKVQLYFDFWAKSSYVSKYSHGGMAGWDTEYYDLISGPGDTTSVSFPTGMPEVYLDYGGTNSAALYVIDEAGEWLDYFVDHIETACKYFYDQGTPLYGIFLDDFANIYSWSCVADLSGNPTYDRNGDQNDATAIFTVCPELWDYYEASDYYATYGDDNWEEMTITEQRSVISEWWAAVPYQQFEDLETRIWSIINSYCVSGGKLVVNGSARRLEDIGVGEENWVPKYGTTRLFEGVGELAYRSFDLIDGGDGTDASYVAWEYCHPNDQILVYCLGASRVWGDWYDGGDGEGERNLQLAANLAMKRGAYVGVGYGETPFDGGTGLSAIFNPNDADNRWPNYVSSESYSTNHSDGTVVYEGPSDHATDCPGYKGDFIYTAFSQNTWGDWSLGGIGFAQALPRKNKTQVTVTSISYDSRVSIFGTLSDSGSTFLDGATTCYNDSTVIPPLVSGGGLPHGQGWYLVGSEAKEVYPIYSVNYKSNGQFDYVECYFDEIDSTSVYVGQVLDLNYLSLTVGNHKAFAPYSSRAVTEDTFPRAAISLTSGKEDWFTSFNPMLDATAVLSGDGNSVDIYIRNVRNPMGIKDIDVYKYDGQNPSEGDWPGRPSYSLASDSTALTTFRDTPAGGFSSFTSYKFVPKSVANVASDRPVYLTIFTDLLSPPNFVFNDFFLGFAPEMSISNQYGSDLTFYLYKNGSVYLTGVIQSSSTVQVYDLFWCEGDSYTATLYTEGSESSQSSPITPERQSSLPVADTNLTLSDIKYIIPIGDSTFTEYEDTYYNLIYRSAVSRVGGFSVGQLVWPGEGKISRYTYRTDIVPTKYGGKESGQGIPPQFEFWNSQDGGDMLIRFEVNPIEFEFDFGIRNRRVSTLDGPDKLQLMYQDHVLRSMLWRNIPVYRYRRFLSDLKSFIGRDVWLDSKDFTMPIRGRLPFRYMAGYRYMINIVDVVVKPVSRRGTQRVDIELKYKLITTDDGAV